MVVVVGEITLRVQEVLFWGAPPPSSVVSSWEGVDRG